MAFISVRLPSQSRCRTHRHPFDLRLPFQRAQPELDSHGIDRETDPERDAEELLWCQMREGTGGKEYAHHGASRGDAEKDCNCSRHPKQLQPRLTPTKLPCPGK